MGTIIPAVDVSIIHYGPTFAQNPSGATFNPHVSPGTAPKEYLDEMLAEPFDTVIFSPAGAVVYKIDPFGTAAKKLKESD